LLLIVREKPGGEIAGQQAWSSATSDRQGDCRNSNLKGRYDMDFLVHITTTFPSTMPGDEREALFTAESKRAAALAEAGRLVRLWRIPGRRANWGLWRAADATELHEALTSLPLWPYMDIEVTALARHPNDPGE